MKRIIIIFFAAIFFISCVTTRSGKVKKLSSFEKGQIIKRIENTIKEGDPNINIGIKITSVDDDKVIYQKNSNRHFMPGSIAKLLTVASALHYLGPSYRFSTKIFTDGLLKEQGAIKNLYIVGSGDPSLLDKDLSIMALELKQLGIKKILGNIYVDDSIFDDTIWTKGAMWDDRKYGYSAPVSGLNINYNRLLIKTVPSLKIKETARTLYRPYCSYLTVGSNTKTKEKSKRKNISIHIENHRESNWPKNTNEGLKKGDHITVDGEIPIGSSPHYSLMAVHDPGLLAATYLHDQLKLLGIETKGYVKRSILPENAIELAKHTSRSLAEALIDFTKISNNIANDALIKAIAANEGNKPASFKEGLRLVNKFLREEVKISSRTFINADGSGASRYSLITPDHIIKLLNYAANRFQMFPEFLSTLPIGGKDGTLRTRLENNNIKGRVRAKTGSLSGVSNLAGYLTDEHGRDYCFVIMINGYVGSSYKYTRMQDQIIGSIFESYSMELANAK